MLTEWLEKTLNLPGIIQGALGSALFLLLLKFVLFIGLRIRRFSSSTTELFNHDQNFREYIYRRYTSRSGYLNFAQGTLLSLSEALKWLVTGLLFCCIALLIGGSLPIIWGMCLVVAIFYFVLALTWLVPRSNWKSDNVIDHWKRVADLEKELLGGIQKETADIIEQLKDPRKEGNGT